jgi:hypothetical protein
MGADRIRRAMNAGKRWAADQIKRGIEITAESSEQAAKDKYDHLGMQYLFMTSALELLFENEAKSANRPQNAA